MIHTPRTDTVLVAWDLTPEPKVLIEHARQLERELDAANERIKRLEALIDRLGLERWCVAKEAKP